MLSLKTFWQFCRPHTIFGSLFSVTTLYILSLENAIPVHREWLLLLLTLVASLACNIFIVGLNQIIDVELDKINKPSLPLAQGTMLIPTAKKIIVIALLLSIAAAFAASYILGILIIFISIIGYLYSVPPIQLKKHHLPAAISITLVRGILVNVGMFVHFRYTIFNTAITQSLPAFLMPLTLFIAAFSVAIAWFKDLPDTKGDALYQFKTISVLYSRKLALVGGSVLVILAYLYCMYWSNAYQQTFLLIAHLILLILFIANLCSVDLQRPKTIKPFYLRFWILFFLEYIIFAIWVLTH
jgi:homogentisate phytyltransferase / homogentisate geranylgeranyltransferase